MSTKRASTAPACATWPPPPASTWPRSTTTSRPSRTRSWPQLEEPRLRRRPGGVGVRGVGVPHDPATEAWPTLMDEILQSMLEVEDFIRLMLGEVILGDDTAFAVGRPSCSPTTQVSLWRTLAGRVPAPALCRHRVARRAWPGCCRALLVGLFVEHVAGVLGNGDDLLTVFHNRAEEFAALLEQRARLTDGGTGPVGGVVDGPVPSPPWTPLHRGPPDERGPGGSGSHPPFAPGTSTGPPTRRPVPVGSGQAGHGGRGTQELQNEAPPDGGAHLRRTGSALPQARRRRGAGSRRHHLSRRSGPGPPHRQTGPEGLGGRGPALGRLPVHRSPPGGAAGHLDRHHRPAGTITVWTRRDLWIEYESGARATGGGWGTGRAPS